ncbi:hypothetical protein LZ32DRAFT_378167 [Colletotrichum eremochloae]|nr:hypothetical protein LZ32DRAFT_378167 [Colletotrichum eremochloae]
MHTDRIGLRSRSYPRGVQMNCNVRPTAYERRTLSVRHLFAFFLVLPSTRAPAIAPSVLSWLSLIRYTRSNQSSGRGGNGVPRPVAFPFLTLAYWFSPICVSEFAHFPRCLI